MNTNDYNLHLFNNVNSKVTNDTELSKLKKKRNIKYQI
jgi:hypothetical protein